MLVRILSSQAERSTSGAIECFNSIRKSARLNGRPIAVANNTRSPSQSQMDGLNLGKQIPSVTAATSTRLSLALATRGRPTSTHPPIPLLDLSTKKSVADQSPQRFLAFEDSELNSGNGVAKEFMSARIAINATTTVPPEPGRRLAATTETHAGQTR